MTKFTTNKKKKEKKKNTWKKLKKKKKNRIVRGRFTEKVTEIKMRRRGNG